MNVREAGALHSIARIRIGPRPLAIFPRLRTGVARRLLSPIFSENANAVGATADLSGDCIHLATAVGVRRALQLRRIAQDDHAFLKAGEFLVRILAVRGRPPITRGTTRECEEERGQRGPHGSSLRSAGLHPLVDGDRPSISLESLLADRPGALSFRRRETTCARFEDLARHDFEMRPIE